MTELKITQADRDAAASYWGNDNPPVELRQAFARHRIAAEEGKAELAEAAEAIKRYLRETPHHNATQAAALRAALARVRGEG